jgi:hypothetical protein
VYLQSVTQAFQNDGPQDSSARDRWPELFHDSADFFFGLPVIEAAVNMFIYR